MNLYTRYMGRARWRHRDLLREAEQYRLLQAGKPARPPRAQKVRQRVGGLLVAAGGKLQEL